MILVLIVICILILFPFPYKISIYYFERKYYIKLYNITLLSDKQRNNSNVKDKKKKEKPKKKKISLSIIYKSIKGIKKSKYKPSIRLYGEGEYSLVDACDTALSYGFYTILRQWIIYLLSILLKVKEEKIYIKPLFKDIFYLKINIKCIINISIGHIIYMTYVIIKEIILEKVREYE